MVEKKYLDILENIAIKYYKGYEHGKVKEVSGAEIDQLMKDSEEYTKKLKELAEEIEKRAQERTLEDTYENVFKILKALFGNKKEDELIEVFEKEVIKKGKAEPRHLQILNELIDAKKKYDSKKKPTKYEIEDVRKNTNSLINKLIEYGQRIELAEIAKMQMRIIYDKGKRADVFLTNPLFVISEGMIKRIKANKLEQSNQQELDAAVFTQKNSPKKISASDLEALKKEFGDFDIIL